MRTVRNSGHLHLVGVLLSFFVVTSVFAQASYTVIDLGVLPGGSNSLGASINNRGDVVGDSNSSTPDVGYTGVLWPASGGITDLGTLPGDFGSDAACINASGLVVGTSYVPGDLYRAVTWRDGVMNVLPVPPDTRYSFAFGVNESRLVVGYVIVEGVPIAALWKAGELSLLVTLPGAEQGGSVARAINNRGDIVGHASTPSGGRAFLWSEHSGAIDLGTLGGGFSDAYAASESAQVVGLSSTAFSYHAFVWSKATGIVDLGTLPGGTRSYALGINNRGQIVGFSDRSDGQYAGVLWDGGRIVDLNTVVPPGSPWIEDARAINAGGLIVGYGNGHALLIKPNSR